jgi:hypothetical protein
VGHANSEGIVWVGNDRIRLIPLLSNTCPACLYCFALDAGSLLSWGCPGDLELSMFLDENVGIEVSMWTMLDLFAGSIRYQSETCIYFEIYEPLPRQLKAEFKPCPEKHF